MLDYFEERKRESESKDDYWERMKKERAVKAHNESEVAEARSQYKMPLKGTVKQKKTARKELHKLFKKPKPKLTVAQKAARSAKRKRTVKKVFRAVRSFIYGKPKTKRKTTTKRKSAKKK